MKACIHCNELIDNHGPNAYLNHIRWCPANPKLSTYKSTRGSGDRVNEKLKTFDRRLLEWKSYYRDPKHCMYCNQLLDWFQKQLTFCSRSCSAKLHNSQQTQESRDRGRIALIATLRAKGKLSPSDRENRRKAKQVLPTSIQGEADVVGAFTRIYLCTCKYTKQEWYSATKQTIHPSAVDTIKQYRYQARFKFSIRTYRDWFCDAAINIDQYGWYSASNRGGNLSGCSRDHILSVADGYKNNIDPSIISHPANCRIVPHRVNQRKNAKSEITITELLRQIDQFNTKYSELGT